MSEVISDPPMAGEVGAASGAPTGDGASTAPDARAADDPAILCLVALLRSKGVPASASQIAHDMSLAGRMADADDVLRQLQRLGLRAGRKTVTLEALALSALPALAPMRDGGFLVVGRVVTETSPGAVQLSVFDPARRSVVLVDQADFMARWDGTLILAARRRGLGSAETFDLSWFIPAVLRFKFALGEVFAASIVLQIFGLVTPLFFQVVVDKVLAQRTLATLDVLMIGLVLVAIFETLLGGVRTHLFAHTANRIDVMLGAKLFNHLQRLPLGYFQARRVGEIVARLRELETVRSFLTDSALSLVLDTLFASIFIAVLFFYSTTLTLIVLASLPLFVLLSLVVTPTLQRRLKEKFARAADNQSFLVESVAAAETVKAMAVEPQMQRRWEDQLAGYVAASFRATTLGNVSGQVAQLVMKLTTAATLYFGALAVMANELTVGQLVAFNMLAGRVTQPVLRLAQMWQEFQQARLAVDRIADILNAPTEDIAASKTTLPAIEGRLQLDNVSFRYKPGAPAVLKSMSLDIAAGQVVGIVGPSGSGKSTLAKLFQRLFVPEEGRVLVDGVDLATINPTWLRRQVGVVLQENVLFNQTIRDNIALADPGLPDARIIEAAKLAGAHDFIVEQPMGYDTVIGEHGVGLSGGQRQRVAIARALVTGPRILIFDEATSALDLESEHAIQRNMREICRGRTVIIIAHRLAAVRHADRILTVEAGRLVEDGSHADLVAAGGRYARLHALQEGGAHVG